MDDEEKAYLDKKLNDFYDKLANPSPELIAAQKRKIYKKMLPWMIAALIACFGTFVFMFWYLGLF